MSKRLKDIPNNVDTIFNERIDEKLKEIDTIIDGIREGRLFLEHDLRNSCAQLGEMVYLNSRIHKKGRNKLR
jgi:hypothetical protein